MKKFNLVLFIILSSFISIVAQDSLSLQQAIGIALKNNFSINIARTQNKIASNNNNIGNAGYLPSVNLNASLSGSNNSTLQEFNSGASVNRNGALSSTINSNVALNWVIFDGLKMFATKEKLNELEAQGILNLKLQIENTIVKIIGSYFDVVRQQQLIRATKEAMKIYDERIKIAELKLNIGSASKIDLLQAKVDLNAQKSLLLKQNTSLDNVKATLNQLLSKDVNDDFIASDSIVVNYLPVYSELQKNMRLGNSALLYTQKNIAIANSTLKELNSLRMPQVSVNASYNINQNKNQVGLILLNQNLGFNTGITASWNLFNGFRTRTQIQSAQFLIEENKLQYEETNSQMEASLVKVFKAYKNLQETLALEEDNTLIAKENVGIALERFKIGSSNSIELMIAQKSYEDALNRVISARYDAKISETELMYLEGTLVK